MQRKRNVEKERRKERDMQRKRNVEKEKGRQEKCRERERK
jgi:hypothetical protein